VSGGYAAHAADFWTQAYGIITIIAAIGGAVATVAWLRAKVYKPLRDSARVILGGEDEPNLRERLDRQDRQLAAVSNRIEAVEQHNRRLSDSVDVIASHDRLEVKAALAAYYKQRGRRPGRADELQA
jgi:hypothetical protein